MTLALMRAFARVCVRVEAICFRVYNGDIDSDNDDDKEDHENVENLINSKRQHQRILSDFIVWMFFPDLVEEAIIMSLAFVMMSSMLGQQERKDDFATERT